MVRADSQGRHLLVVRGLPFLKVVPYERWSVGLPEALRSLWFRWDDTDKYPVSSWRKIRQVELVPSYWRMRALPMEEVERAVRRVLTECREDGKLRHCSHYRVMHFAVFSDGTIVEWVPGTVDRIENAWPWLSHAVRIWLDGGLGWERSREQLASAGRLAGWVCYRFGLDVKQQLKWIWMETKPKRYLPMMERELETVRLYAERVLRDLRYHTPVTAWQFVREAQLVEQRKIYDGPQAKGAMSSLWESGRALFD